MMDQLSELNGKVEFFRRITASFNMNSIYHKNFSRPKTYRAQREEVYRLWDSFLAQKSDPFLSLYVHFPFCSDRCCFCIYQSDILRRPDQIESHLACLEKEILYFKGLFSRSSFTTLYFGGGTPSLMSEEQLKRLFSMVFSNFSFNGNGTKCIEYEPRTVTEGKVLVAKDAGIDRISMGVQSLNQEVMLASNRGFVPYPELRRSIELVNSQGFSDFNIDLMALLPGDSISRFSRTVEGIMSLEVPSVTIYFYKHKPNLKFTKLIPPEKYKRYQDYSEPYSREELFSAIRPIVEQYKYEAGRISPSMVSQLFFRKGHRPPISNPTQPRWSLKNSTFGLGLTSQSFIGHRVEYVSLSSDTLSFDGLFYSVREYSEMDNMRFFVLSNLEDYKTVDSSEFRASFDKDLFSVFRDEINALCSLGKAEVDGKNLVMLTKSQDELRTYLKFFYDQDYLKELSVSGTPSA